MELYRMQQTDKVCGGVQVRVRVPVFTVPVIPKEFADRCHGHLSRLAARFCGAVCTRQTDAESAAMLVCVSFCDAEEISLVIDFSRCRERCPTAFLRVGERWMLQTAELLAPRHAPAKAHRADGWYRCADGVFLYRNGFDPSNPAHLRRPQSSVSVFASLPQQEKKAFGKSR